MKRFLLLPLAVVTLTAQAPDTPRWTPATGMSQPVYEMLHPRTSNRIEDGCRDISSDRLVRTFTNAGNAANPWRIAGAFNLHPETFIEGNRQVMWACAGFVEVVWLRSGQSQFMRMITYAEGNEVQIHMVNQ